MILHNLIDYFVVEEFKNEDTVNKVFIYKGTRFCQYSTVVRYNTAEVVSRKQLQKRSCHRLKVEELYGIFFWGIDENYEEDPANWIRDGF